MGIAIALAKCSSYDDNEVEKQVFNILEAANIQISRGGKILVKPNLLLKRPLACTSPQTVYALCKWLLDQGAAITVADSPAFGKAEAIADAIGLGAKLKKLGLRVKSLSGRHMLNFQIDAKKVSFPISPQVFDNDAIFSIFRVKAHAQMRLTLAVKNCFGMIPGLHKPFVHTFYGDSSAFFASCIASLYASLPPVLALADGVIAMHVTGPAKGQPYPLGLLGASSDPVALDRSIMKILNAHPASVPIACALEKIFPSREEEYAYPLEAPEAFDASGFILPQELKSASFNPWRLAKSCMKRIWNRVKI